MDKNTTLYEWCLVNDKRPLDLDSKNEDDFMLKEISYDEFVEYLRNGHYKDGSAPRKPEKYLELRMYGLVPYNLSPIQQGIQFNHANDNYSLEWGTSNEQYDRFRKEWKTNILLNGGTSNEGHLVRQGFKDEMYYGSMQGHLADLKANAVKCSTFYEPDLNSMLTSIVFLVDERVFNKKLYPDFEQLLYEGDTNEEFVEWSSSNMKQYNQWVTKIGGPTNAFLREFLRGKKLA
jgi:hypothetical protein